MCYSAAMSEALCINGFLLALAPGQSITVEFKGEKLGLFADRKLTVPIPNPVQADANGRLPPIWIGYRSDIITFTE